MFVATLICGSTVIYTLPDSTRFLGTHEGNRNRLGLGDRARG